MDEYGYEINPITCPHCGAKAYKVEKALYRCACGCCWRIEPGWRERKEPNGHFMLVRVYPMDPKEESLLLQKERELYEDWKRNRGKYVKQMTGAEQ